MMKPKTALKRKLYKFDWFDYINYIFLAIFTFLTFYPFIFVFAGAFNQGTDYMRGGVFFWPRVFSLDNFTMILNDNRLLIGFKNTIARTILGTISATFFTSMIAYAMSRKDLPFRDAIHKINLFTLFFGGGLIPFYLVLKNLDLLNHFSVYLIPTLYSVFNMIVLQSYFKDIPEEIHESALMDGAGEFRIFLQIYLPLSKPIIATVALWIAVFHWNSFFDSMVFTTNANLQTLQYFLVKLIKEASFAQGEAAAHVPSQVVRTTSITTLRYAAIVLSTIPILAVYPFMQRYLIKGIMIGSIKG
jgi:putative aldouronate transport system permease protein